MYRITLAEAVVTNVSKEKEAGVLLMIAVGDRDTYVDCDKALLSLCGIV